MSDGGAREAGGKQGKAPSWQFCATQCNLRCNAACQTRTECGSDARTQAALPPQTAAEVAFWFGQNPSPLREERFERPQLFGLAASIAARLTISPISLACSAR